MDRARGVGWVLGLGVFVAAGATGPALARDDDPDRQARRHELRQQLQLERERWRADGRVPGGYAMPPGQTATGGYGPPPHRPPGYGPPAYGVPAYGVPGVLPPRHGGPPADAPSAYAPGPGPGAPGGWGGAPRLSPDERRALREELRQHRP